MNDQWRETNLGQQNAHGPKEAINCRQSICERNSKMVNVLFTALVILSGHATNRTVGRNPDATVFLQHNLSGSEHLFRLTLASKNPTGFVDHLCGRRCKIGRIEARSRAQFLKWRRLRQPKRSWNFSFRAVTSDSGAGMECGLGPRQERQSSKKVRSKRPA